MCLCRRFVLKIQGFKVGKEIKENSEAAAKAVNFLPNAEKLAIILYLKFQYAESFEVNNLTDLKVWHPRCVRSII